MAKKLYKAPKHFTGHAVTTKTHFGSTADMVVDHSAFKNITINEGQVLCKDDSGYYITLLNRINDGLADPNRYANISQRIIVEEEQTEEVSSST
jgi:hypothetical protein